MMPDKVAHYDVTNVSPKKNLAFFLFQQFFSEVVMTPLRAPDNMTKVIRVERMQWKKLDENHIQHIAGGPYRGIIVNKAANGIYIHKKVL